jgi:hypothetical protein
MTGMLCGATGGVGLTIAGSTAGGGWITPWAGCRVPPVVPFAAGGAITSGGAGVAPGGGAGAPGMTGGVPGVTGGAVCATATHGVASGQAAAVARQKIMRMVLTTVFPCAMLDALV